FRSNRILVRHRNLSSDRVRPARPKWDNRELALARARLYKEHASIDASAKTGLMPPPALRRRGFSCADGGQIVTAQESVSLDSFKSRKTLSVEGKTYSYFSLPDAEKNGLAGISRLPYAMKVLLENLLRHENGRPVSKADISAISAWLENRGKVEKQIGFRPARVLMQDFTGVPAVVDLAAMRDGMNTLGGDPRKINPLVPVDLVIDHSVIVDEFGSPRAFARNVELEYE